MVKASSDQSTPGWPAPVTGGRMHSGARCSSGCVVECRICNRKVAG